MTGLEKTDTPILSGYQIFHNYISDQNAMISPFGCRVDFK